MMLDGHVTRNTTVLSEKAALGDFLVLCADACGLTKIGLPYVVTYKTNGREDGLSGVQFVSESDIQAHTYPEIGFIYLDLFSCKTVPEGAVKYIREFLGLETHFYLVLPHRGHQHLFEERAAALDTAARREGPSRAL